MAGKRVRPNLRSEDGVTLVELLAAIILLSIIVISFMGFFTQAAKTNNQTNAVNEATYLAQQEMELLTHYSNSKISIEELYDTAGDFHFINDLRQTQANGYEISTTIVHPPVESSTNLYKVTVTVRKGGETSVQAQMESYLPFAETAEPLPSETTSP